MTLTTRSARTFMLRLLLCFCLSSSAQALPTFTFSRPAVTVGIGDAFELDLMANGVEQGLGGWSVGVSVADAGIARLTGISFSAALGAVGSEALGFGDPAVDGLMTVAGSRRTDFGVASLLSAADLGALQGASFRLATLSFTALAAGTTQLSLSWPSVGASSSDAAGNAGANALGGAVLTVGATVSPVPELPTAALLAAGLACIGMFVRAGRP